MFGLKKYVPGVGKAFKVLADEINLVTKSGSGSSASVAAGATVAVTITHEAFALNTVPEVSTATTGGEVTVANIKPGSFVINVKNTTAAALTVAYDWKRVGI